MDTLSLGTFKSQYKTLSFMCLTLVLREKKTDLMGDKKTVGRLCDCD